MSSRLVHPSLKRFGLAAFLLLAVPALSWAQEGCAGGACFGTPSTGSCSTGYCQTHHCPPPFEHCMEEPPCIHFKCGCPRPVCNPCDLPHWGYYDKCWTPWPYPANWTHCPTPPPAAFVGLNSNPNAPTYLPSLPPRGPISAPPAAMPGPNPMPPISNDGLMPPPQRYDSPRQPF